MNSADFFHQASGLFLTEYLTIDEFDKIVSKGDCLPVCSDYEYWNSDQLEDRIKEVASQLKKAYDKGIEDESRIDLDIDFIQLAKDLKSICVKFPEYKEDSFSNLVLDDGAIIGNIYFSKGHTGWSVRVGGLKYTSWTEGLLINMESRLFTNRIADIARLREYIAQVSKLVPKRRSLDFTKLTKTKE